MEDENTLWDKHREFEYLDKYYSPIVHDIYKELCRCYHGHVVYPGCVKISNYELLTDRWWELRVYYWNIVLNAVKERYPEIAMELYLLDILS